MLNKLMQMLGLGGNAQDAGTSNDMGTPDASSAPAEAPVETSTTDAPMAEETPAMPAMPESQETSEGDDACEHCGGEKGEGHNC